MLNAQYHHKHCNFFSNIPFQTSVVLLMYTVLFCELEITLASVPFVMCCDGCASFWKDHVGLLSSSGLQHVILTLLL